MLWRGSLLWLELDPWPRNFHLPRERLKKEKGGGRMMRRDPLRRATTLPAALELGPGGPVGRSPAGQREQCCGQEDQPTRGAGHAQRTPGRGSAGNQAPEAEAASAARPNFLMVGDGVEREGARGQLCCGPLAFILLAPRPQALESHTTKLFQPSISKQARNPWPRVCWPGGLIPLPRGC